MKLEGIIFDIFEKEVYTIIEGDDKDVADG